MKKLALIGVLLLPIAAFGDQQCPHYTDAQLESMTTEQLQRIQIVFINSQDDDNICDYENDRITAIVDIRLSAINSNLTKMAAANKQSNELYAATPEGQIFEKVKAVCDTLDVDGDGYCGDQIAHKLNVLDCGTDNNPQDPKNDDPKVMACMNELLRQITVYANGLKACSDKYPEQQFNPAQWNQKNDCMSKVNPNAS